MTVEFTTSQLAEAVRLVAKENRNFQYDADTMGIAHSCVYFRDGEPSCIVGHGLSRLGLTIDDIDGLNESSDVYDLAEYLGLPFDRSLNFLFHVQSAQDSGKPWGEAVRSADSRVKEESIE